MQLIGMDLGSTSIKAGVLDTVTKRVTLETRRPFPGPLVNLPRGHFEVSARAVCVAVDDVLDGLLAAAPDAEAIILCSQMHSMVLTNATGLELSNILTWQDQRAALQDEGRAPLIQELKRTLGVDRLLALGNDVWAARPVAMLVWLAQHNQLPPNALFCSLPDFVGRHWCGGAELATDRTHAAASGMYDILANTWHHDALAALGLDKLRLPMVVDERAVIGQVRRAGRTLDLLAPVSDQQCALLGAGLAMGELSINVSTGSQVAMMHAAPITGGFQTRPYFAGRWLATLIHLPAGRALNALVQLLSQLAEAEGHQLRDQWSTIERMTRMTPASDIAIDLSFFAGALGDHGQIGNLREDNLTIGHVFRSAFAQMAQNYYRAALALDPSASWKGVVLSGGLARQSSVLQQEIASQFECPVRMPEGAEDALTGILSLFQ